MSLLFSLVSCSDSSSKADSSSVKEPSSSVTESKTDSSSPDSSEPADSSSGTNGQKMTMKEYLNSFDNKNKTYQDIGLEIINNCNIQPIELSKANLSTYGTASLYGAGLNRVGELTAAQNNSGKQTYITQLELGEEKGTFYVIFGSGNITAEQAEEYIPKGKDVYFYGIVVEGTEKEKIPSVIPMIIGTEETGYQKVTQNISQLNFK